jgi:hypothetical protein
VPLSNSISPAAIFRSVDLPEPLRPTRQIRACQELGAAAERQTDILKRKKRRRSHVADLVPRLAIARRVSGSS